MLPPMARKIALFLVTLIVVAKLFLIADQEIFGRQFDDFGYAMSAIHHYFGVDARSNWEFIRPLGFPLWGALVMESGIPYRIAIELLFLGTAGFFAFTLSRLLGSSLLGLAAFALLAFHPWALTGFTQYMTEPYFLSLILVFTALCLRLIARPQGSWKDPEVLALGPLVALMMLTRREEPWVFGLIASAFALRALLQLFQHKLPWKRCALQLLLLLVPAFTYQAVMLSVSTANYLKWGLFVTNEQEAKGFSGLLDALYAIKTPDPSIWAPVTRQTLEMAMEVSPRMAQLREGLFNENNPHLDYGEATTGRKGELGAWMWWRLYESVATAGLYNSPKEADAWMQAATAEIEAAFKDGRLPQKRFATSFPLDPNFGIWLPHLPKLTWDALRRLYYRSGEPDFTHHESAIPAYNVRVFDKAANRRADRLAAGSVEVSGQVFASTGRIDFIALEDESGIPLASTSPQGVLYWIDDAVAELAEDVAPFPTAFYLRWVPQDDRPLFLSIWKDGERLYTQALLNPVEKPQRTLHRPVDGSASVSLNLMRYTHPLREPVVENQLIFRGWAFAGTGALTHLTLSDGDRPLKTQAFTLIRNDLDPFYTDLVGSAPAAPLGFHLEATYAEAAELKVAFWKGTEKIHEAPLHSLPKGSWGTLEETLSGIPFRYGIGRQEITTSVPELKAPLRPILRSSLIGSFTLVILGLSGLCALALYRIHQKQEKPTPPNRPLLLAILAFLGLLLFSRGLFYGLVEAAVVPGVTRYMDCAAPLFSVLLFLLLPAALLLIRTPRPSGQA
jgi:hypothetical protein